MSMFNEVSDDLGEFIMDGQFSAFVTPSGGGLFAYNAPEFPGGPGQPQGTGPQPATSPQGGSQTSPVNGPQQVKAAAPQTSSSPPPQPQQQASESPVPQQQQPPAQVVAPQAQQPQPAPQQLQAPQQPVAQQPAPQQQQQQQPQISQQPKAHMEPSRSSLLETLFNDTGYASAPVSAGFDTTINSAIGNANNLADIRLENMGPGAQAFLAAHPSLQQAQQLHQQAGGGPIPNFLQFQHQAANASPQYMQQATAAHFLQQQNAALQAQLPTLLAQQSPLLAQQALVQNVYSKYGLGGPGYPTPIKTPGAPIKTTDSDKGPEGCNLFVFHIPNDMTNLDLYQMFSTFGQVISARIMVDKVTGRSRGFGFVSYNNPESAEQAIKSMNGFVVGHKRLKVEQKKDKNSVMPPSAAHPSAAYYATLQRWQVHLHNQAHAHLQAQAHAQVPPAAATAHYLAPPTSLYQS